MSKPADAPSPRWRLLVEPIASLLVAAAASVAYGLTFGFTYGVNNQTEYMLGALRHLDPALFADDWLASHTLNYHPAFGYLAWLLLVVGGRGGWGVGIALVVAVAAGSLCLYWLARRSLPVRSALPAFLIVVAAMTATGTREMAGTYVFDPIFQPSTVATVLFLAALPPFVERRWLLSGGLFAVAGLFHANFLVLGLGAFVVAHLVLGRQGLVHRAVRQLGPSMGVLVLLSPVILQAVRGGENVARAREILFLIRSPHHYNPRSFIGDFFPFLGWQALGLGLGGWMFRRGEGRGRALGAVLAGLVAVVWAGTALSVVFDVGRVTQLFVWRLAPFVDVFMQLLVAASVVRLLIEPSASWRLGRAEALLALAGAVALGVGYVHQGESTVSWLVDCGVAGGLGFGLRLAAERWPPVAARSRSMIAQHGPWVAGAAASLLVVSVVKGPLEGMRAHSNLLRGLPGGETDLYAWLRDNTTKDAIILSPPGLERFRLASERPIVVDWKGVPYAPRDLLEWYARLEEVSGKRGFRSRDEVVAGYEGMDGGRLDRLREKYHLSYAVVSRGREAGLGHRVAWANAQFTVVDLR